MKNDHDKMTSVKPYLIRAFHEWIVANQLTPYIDVNTAIPKTDVPQEYIRDDRITLNIAPSAIKDLRLGNEFITFYARFSGAVQFVQVPMRAILAIYARENGRGSVFNEKEEEEGSSGSEENAPQQGKGKPFLKIIK